MSCYTPISGFFNEFRKISFQESQNVYGSVKIPCGGCLGCRLDRCREWGIRCTHEAKLKPDHNIFVTLTFDEDHLKNRSVQMKPFQDFMKRLRSRYQSDRIRYFHATEYGDRFLRPHHHAIIFNYRPDDSQIFKKSKTGDLFISKKLSEIWQNGFVTFGECNQASAQYVASYTIKKDSKTDYVDKFTGEILAKEKMSCSRQPSIGLEFFKKFQDQYLSQDFILDAKNVPVKIPRAYMKYVEENNPAIYSEVKIRRENKMIEHEPESDVERYSRYLYMLERQKRYKRSLDTDYSDPRLLATITNFRRVIADIQQRKKSYETFFNL